MSSQARRLGMAAVAVRRRWAPRRAVEGSRNPAPAEAGGVGGHALPGGAVEAEREGAALDLDAELGGAAGGEEIEGAAGAARLVDEIEAEAGEESGDLAFGGVADEGHGDDAAAGAAPAEPEGEDGIVEGVRAVVAAAHEIAEALEVPGGVGRGDAEAARDVDLAGGAVGEGVDDGDQVRGAADRAVEHELEVEGEAAGAREEDLLERVLEGGVVVRWWMGGERLAEELQVERVATDRVDDATRDGVGDAAAAGLGRSRQCCQWARLSASGDRRRGRGGSARCDARKRGRVRVATEARGRASVAESMQRLSIVLVAVALLGAAACGPNRP
jgi:hypothetical protein